MVRKLSTAAVNVTCDAAINLKLFFHSLYGTVSLVSQVNLFSVERKLEFHPSASLASFRPSVVLISFNDDPLLPSDI